MGSETSSLADGDHGDERYDPDDVDRFDDDVSGEVEFPEDERVGYRVLNVARDSPASTKEDSNLLVSFFDVLIAANGNRLLDNDWFVKCIRDAENGAIELVVYNCKMRTVRDVVIKPSRAWGEGKSLLGLTIKYDSFDDDADDFTLRVLDVYPDSPAAAAGLCAGDDYLLGTPHMTFQDLDDLNDAVLASVDALAPMEIYVYNAKTDAVRRTAIAPSDAWGGDGLIGCSIGQGYLHRIPFQCRNTLGVNGFDDANFIDANHQRHHPASATFNQNQNHPRAATLLGPGSIVESDLTHHVVRLDWGIRSDAATVVARLRDEHVERC